MARKEKLSEIRKKGPAMPEEIMSELDMEEEMPEEMPDEEMSDEMPESGVEDIMAKLPSLSQSELADLRDEIDALIEGGETASGDESEMPEMT